MERAFDEKLAANDRLGLLVDMTGWSDMTADAIAEDAKFEMGLATKLGRFSRMALVSDKQFVEAAVRMLGPLLASLEMRTFAPDDRDAALASAAEPPTRAPEGRRSVSLIETDAPDCLAFEIDGRFAVQDLETVAAPLREAFARGGEFDLLVRMKNFEGFDPAILTKSSLFATKMAGLKHLRRYAVVGGEGWMEGLIEKFGPLVPMDVRAFDLADEGSAWAWLKS